MSSRINSKCYLPFPYVRVRTIFSRATVWGGACRWILPLYSCELEEADIDNFYFADEETQAQSNYVTWSSLNLIQK